MICPNCGAENEVGARFCVECGAPLENQIILPDRPPEDDDDDDQTILSSASYIAEQAKTMAVTQDQLAAAEAEAASVFDSEPPKPDRIPTPPTGTSSGSQGGGQGLMTQRNIIIAVVVILVLLCCCCTLIIGSILAQPGVLENIISG
jgi:hypothetical protein